MTDNIGPILEKAQESLAAAELLLQQGFTDFAASRAYYAMFYVAEALLLQRGLTFSSHSAVLAAFGKEFARTKELDPVYHRFLILAQEYRQQGDYNFGPGVTPEQVQDVVEWGRQFLEEARNYLKRKMPPSDLEQV